MTEMDHAISEYQKWKQQGASLRSQAKHAMETRFRDLLAEAAQIAQEYHADFGVNLKPPAQITAFRYNSAAKGAVKGAIKNAAAPKAAEPIKKVDPKVVELQKRLAQTNKKLEAVKAAGKDTKNLDDKIYEIEDAIRLATDA
jgi:phage shock protein A